MMFAKELWYEENDMLKFNDDAFAELMRKEIQVATPEPNQSSVRWHARQPTALLMLALWPFLDFLRQNTNYKSENKFGKGLIIFNFYLKFDT